MFDQIERTFAPDVRVFHNLPLANILDVDDLPQGRLKDFALKTSVDYTACHSLGAPLVSVEFDGEGAGFSKSGMYVQRAPSRDRFRSFKLQQKLDLCRRADYPLFVVSWSEARTIWGTTGVTIAHGILGAYLARREYESRAREYLERWTPEFAETPERDRWMIEYQAADQASVDADFAWNPLTRAAAEMLRPLNDRYPGFELEHAFLPALDADEIVCEARFRHAGTEAVGSSRVHRIDDDLCSDIARDLASIDLARRLHR